MTPRPREKATCVKIATTGDSRVPFAKMWRFADGVLLKTIQVGPRAVDCPADLYPVGMSFDSAVSPVRKKS